MLARLVGLGAAINLAYLAAIVLAASSFYLVARYLRWGLDLVVRGRGAFRVVVLHGAPLHAAFQFDLLLALSVLAADLLVDYQPTGYSVWEPAILVQLRRRCFHRLEHLYYTYFFLQLLALATLTRLVRGYPRGTLCPPLVLAALTVVLSLTALADTFYYQARHGWNHGAALRQLADLELYSLRPIDLFLPFSHRLSPLESFVRS